MNFYPDKLYRQLLLPLLAASPAVASAQNQERPNVVIILADDLGYGDLSCYGAHRISTPNTDRIAGEGIRFTNAHSVASTSTPSRFSLLTGIYAFRQEGTGVAQGDAASIIAPDTYTLADMFSDAGYTTAAIGKWHLGLGSETGAQDWNGKLDISPADLGFDTHYIMAATADRTPCVFIEDGRIADFDPSAPVEVSYKGPFEDVPDYRRTPVSELKLHSSNGHDHAVVNGIGRIGYMKGGGKALWKDENIADSITAHAVQFIRDHSSGPFFLYFATNDVHVPRMPHERFRGKSPMGLRGEAILQFDYSVGQIMDALEQNGALDNTIIILTSDNGPVLDDGYEDLAAELVGDHSITGGLRGSKYSAYEGGTRIPVIVSWPERITQASVSSALVSQIDLFRSLASILGTRLPEGAAPDSHDLSKTLLGADTDGREWAVEWSYTLSIRTHEWKYIAPSSYPKSLSWCPGIETGTDPQPQLYRLPDEHKNISAEYPEIVEKLQRLLETICGD